MTCSLLWIICAAFLPGAPVAVIGSSLGGAAALLAGPRLEIEALVLESVYPTVEPAAANRLRTRLGFLAKPATPLLLMQLRLRLGISVDDLRPVDKIAKIECPKLIISGTDDRYTTADDTCLLYDAAE